MIAVPSTCQTTPIDYVFTDPPFGENIYYADLNYLVESWHRVRTASGPEAIIETAPKARTSPIICTRCIVASRNTAAFSSRAAG